MEVEKQALLEDEVLNPSSPKCEHKGMHGWKELEQPRPAENQGFDSHW